MANRAKGAGSENTEGYPGCQYDYLNIENIHVMRDSLKKLREGAALLYEVTLSVRTAHLFGQLVSNARKWAHF